MTINFKTNVRTVIRYKGQEYSSADQLPAEARSAYESALPKGVVAAGAPATKQLIVLNGQHFASPENVKQANRNSNRDEQNEPAVGFIVERAGSWFPFRQLQTEQSQQHACDETNKRITECVRDPEIRYGSYPKKKGRRGEERDEV